MATLITLQDYKTFSGISNNNDDAKLSVILALVQEFVETYCARHFIKATYTEQVSDQTGLLFLRNLPLVSVTSVSYIDIAKESVSMAATEYIAYLEEGSIELYDYATKVSPQVLAIHKPFTVTYVGGFTETPPTLKLAIMELVTYYFKHQYINKTSSVNVNVQSEDTQSNSNLPPHIKRILDLYRVQ